MFRRSGPVGGGVGHGPGTIVGGALAARAYGCWAEGPVTDPDDLGPAHGRAVAAVEAGKFAVLDVRTKPR